MSGLFSRTVNAFKIERRPFCQKVTTIVEEAELAFSLPCQKELYAKQIAITKPWYYFERDCRCVYPYFNFLQSRARKQWVGRSVADVYFQDMPRPNKRTRLSAIEKGLMRVNKEKVSPDYVMKPYDVLSHFVHRHENPIAALPFKIIHKDENLIVIDKPPSIPTHRGGRYKFNSLTGILARSLGIKAYSFNRLDMNTSGLMIFALNQEKARIMTDQMMKKLVTKEYLCEVKGNFPYDEIEVDVPLGRCFLEDGPVIVDRVSGQPSLTRFKKINYNGKTSVISCFPLTGRTHQIRVHLQYLGFPIVNDYFYDSIAFGPKFGKDGDYYGLTDREIFLGSRETLRMHLEELYEESIDSEDEFDKLLEHYGSSEWYEYTEKYQYHPENDSFYEDCHHCQNRPLAIRDKQFLHLHAIRYKGPDWEFSADLPYWTR